MPALGSRAATLRQQMADARLAARAYTRAHGEDDPAISSWTWPAQSNETAQSSQTARSSEMNSSVRVLVVNAGSSSVKLRLLDGETVEHSADLPAGPEGFDVPRMAELLRGWGRPDAAGHRIVHGGRDFTGPIRIDDDVRLHLEALVDLAPLLQPKSLAALDAVSAELPGVPAVASFDTTFHASLPEAAAVSPGDRIEP